MDFLRETMRPALLYLRSPLVSPPGVLSAVPCMTCARDPVVICLVFNIIFINTPE